MHWDRELTAVQAAQLGLVTYAQLRKLGLSDSTIRRAIDDGRLTRVRRGVYSSAAVAPTFEQQVLAAVLAAGDGSLASHISAARLWAMPCGENSTLLEVTTVLERQPRVSGVRMHRSGLLRDPDLTVLRGIPVTSPERTLYDLSGRLGRSTLGRAIDDAMRRRLASYGRLIRLGDRLRPAPGRSLSKMAAVLAARGPDAHARESDLEDFVVESLRRFAIPLPVPQHRVKLGGQERRIDLCYPEVLLALEAQGFDYHGQRSRFDDDALRGNELQLAGFRVLEFTSAFDDWTIARHVAIALGLKPPPRPDRVTSFQDFMADRERLCG